MLKTVVAFITGGAGSLGSATAARLVSEGAKVALVDLPSSKGAQMAEELGERARFFPADVTDEKGVAEALDNTVKEFGKINTLVNCAAIGKSRVVFNFKKESAIKIDEFNNILNVNIGGTVNVIRLGAHRIWENAPDEDGLRGVVVNVSGFGAFDGQSGHAAMSASWGAIASMTLPLCRELGAAGIRVMTIAPGLISSNLTSSMPGKVTTALSSVTPSPKRLGTADEFAHLVQCILENRFLNGEVIRLDGGLRVNLF